MSLPESCGGASRICCEEDIVLHLLSSEAIVHDTHFNSSRPPFASPATEKKHSPKTFSQNIQLEKSLAQTGLNFAAMLKIYCGADIDDEVIEIREFSPTAYHIALSSLIRSNRALLLSLFRSSVMSLVVRLW